MPLPSAAADPVRRPRPALLLAVLTLLLAALPWAPAAGAAQGTLTHVDPSLMGALHFRMVGPHRGGRVTAVTGYPDELHTFLMGTVGGGIWRTTDAGISWQNISDGQLDVAPIGALAIAPSNRLVIYAGTGSGQVRGNISVGKGVYRSTDGGDTWSWIGLPEAGQINRIQVHPDDPNVVWVTALGHIFGPNPERGVYRTTDGGAHWERVLFESPRTGAIDLVMSPDDPDVLYAALWQAERKPWAMFSGADEGGIWKTTDGGDSWTKLTEGLPDRVGRIGLAVSPADAARVYALVEAEGDLRGLYRSDDAGATFTHVSDDRNMTARPWYYMHVDAHPTDRDVIFINNESFFRSDDAGETLVNIPTPHGDNHDLWINPKHPEIWIQSNDGGANVTFNAGKTWSTQLNQPTAEFYTVVADDAFPYRLYAPQQDNTTITVPSRVTQGITPYENWEAVAGCETGPVVVNPVDRDVVYGGCKGEVSRYDRRTGQTREIWLWPQEPHALPNSHLKFREQWNSQIRFSPHDADVLYHTSQFVHVTRDEGQTWERISPDLTRWEEHAELHQEPPGGPLTYDQTGVEVYGTVFAFEESPLRQGLLWAGSDDGAVHLSRNGGRSWTDITPSGMALHTTVNEIVLSPHAAGRAFVVAHRYRMDDFRPLIWRTDDYGATWTLLTPGDNGIPADHPTRSLQEDPVRKGLLYAGTEFGLFVSFDDGAHWQSFQLDLPITPVMDLLVHRNDLIVATQGRSLWILDDLSPLQQLDREVALAEAHLFEPRPTHRLRLRYSGSRTSGARGVWPENPDEGVYLYYTLAETPEDPVRLEITDGEGRVVETFASRDEDGEPGPLGTSPGLNRIAWDLKYADAYLAPGVNEGFRERIAVVTGYTGGPYAVPGTYTATLIVGDERLSRSVQVLADPRSDVPMGDLRRNFELSLQLRDRITAIQQGVALGQRALGRLERFVAITPVASEQREAEAVHAELEAVLGELYKHGQKGDHAHLYPRLTTDYARIYTMVASSDHRPPDVAYERFDELEPVYDDTMARLEAVLARARALR
jgi:photosystem II stability/assembly factor-like uncharacterized protein